MCGICGVVGNGDPDILDRMLRRLIHRGPDEEGRHRDGPVAIGARRLRVIDPAGGQQPVRNETGSVWAVMNGEIYNYRSLRDELIRKGHRFQSNCDTEVLVHLYEEEGPDAVRRLRGMFAYALWDADRKRLLLVRDRLGIKPLYYAVGPPLVFASELPSLLEALPGWGIRPRAIADYLNLLYVPGPETIFEGVRQLQPGEGLTIADGRLATWRYSEPGNGVPAERVAPSLEEIRERFLAALRDSVRAHLMSDVPLGLFLSGGLDSGSILAIMREVIDGPIKTFSIGYEAEADQSYNELDPARRVAAHFGAHHTEELLRPDAVSLLPRVVAGMGEPFADSSAIPTYLVSEVARRSVTVALSGIGGDELFGGYPRYLGLRAAGRYAWLPRGVRAWIAAHVAPHLPEGSGGRDHLGRLRRFLMDGHRAIDDQYLRWTTFVPPEWGNAAFGPAVRPALADGSFEARYRALFAQWPSRASEDRAMGLDLQTYLPDDLLRMGDRMSMAHSLELRVPFCDQDLLAFALTLPSGLRFSGLQLKGFMRDALQPLLSPQILAGPKKGFRVPLARWLREDLRDLVHDLLSERAVGERGYLQPAYVRWLLEEHESGRRNFADAIYAVLVLELWHRGIGRSPAGSGHPDP